MKTDQLYKNKVKSKVEVVLYIYDQLISGKSVNASQIMNEFNICDRTFRRYISEINSFLYNNYKNQEVVYNHTRNSYCMEEITIFNL